MVEVPSGEELRHFLDKYIIEEDLVQRPDVVQDGVRVLHAAPGQLAECIELVPVCSDGGYGVPVALVHVTASGEEVAIDTTTATTTITVMQRS